VVPGWPMTELARVRAAMRRGQDWWRRVGVPTPLLVPTDLAGLAFGGMTNERGGPRHLGPRRSLTLALIVVPVDRDRQERLIVRQEPAAEMQGILAQVPDLREERDVPLHGVTARLSVGGADPPAGSAGSMATAPCPTSRCRACGGTPPGSLYLVQAWGLEAERLRRVAASLRPRDDDRAAGEPEDQP